MKLNLSEENDEKISEKNQKSLQIGILGIPNAGKSELTNRLVGHKITAVSSKENTTVSPRLGAYVEDDTQVILYDLPGVIRQKDIRYKYNLLNKLFNEKNLKRTNGKSGKCMDNSS